DTGISYPFPLSLHDALPIFARAIAGGAGVGDRARGLAQQQPVLADEIGIRREHEQERLARLLLVLDLRATAIVARAVQHPAVVRSEEHTSELQSRRDLVCRL